MLETMAIFIVFLVLDVILCIKIVPLFSFIFGIINLPVIFFVLLPDSTISIYYSFILGLLAVIVIAFGAIKMKG